MIFFEMLFHAKVPPHEDVWRSASINYAFLTSVPVGGTWSTSHCGIFVFGSHCTGGWMGPRADLDVLVKRIG